MRREVALLLIVAGVVAVAVWLMGKPDSRTSPTVTAVTTESRIPTLQTQLAEQRVESLHAVAGYTPAVKTGIDDLTSPVVDLLRQLPGVVHVDVGVSADNPAGRLIHLRDWHFVPKDLFALDLKEAHGRELSAGEIDRLYQEHLLEVELVQAEQKAVLLCLVKHHGLKRVFAEGFSQDERDAYRERIDSLRAIETEQIPRVRSQLDDVRSLIRESTGERKEKAIAIETQLVAMLDDHRLRLLEVGAAGQLLIAGELDDVLPLEDAAALEGANPTGSGGVSFDAAKVEARHDAQVKAVMKEGPVAVIILGGSHDLSGSVRKFGGGNCEYVRMTTKRYREVAE